MRAVYYPELPRPEGEKILSLEGEYLHHLTRVARIKKGEKILLLNGKGGSCPSEVLDLSRDSVQLSLGLFRQNPPYFPLDLGLVVPKKETLDEVIKLSVELGLRRLIPLQGDYSWPHYQKGDRVNRLIESAMIQSNNPFYLELAEHIPLKQWDLSSYEWVFYFVSRPLEGSRETRNSLKQAEFLKGRRKGPYAFLVGPEGGLSPEEEAWVETQGRTFLVHLPTPILRTPHAVAAATGHILGWAIERDGNL